MEVRKRKGQRQLSVDRLELYFNGEHFLYIR